MALLSINLFIHGEAVLTSIHVCADHYKKQEKVIITVICCLALICIKPQKW